MEKFDTCQKLCELANGNSYLEGMTCYEVIKRNLKFPMVSPLSTRSYTACRLLRVHVSSGSTGIPMLALIASDLVRRRGSHGSVFIILSRFSRFFRSGVGLSGPKPMSIATKMCQQCSASPCLSIGYRFVSAFYRGRKLWAVASDFS